MPKPKSQTADDFGTDGKLTNVRRSDWPKVLQYICARLIDNGLGALVVLGLTTIGLVTVITYGMNSSDRKEILLAVLGRPGLAVLGWAIAFVEFFVFKYLFALRDRTHETELKRVAQVKNDAVQAKFPFELQSSEQSAKSKE